MIPKTCLEAHIALHEALNELVLAALEVLRIPQLLSWLAQVVWKIKEAGA